jgi:hypothetical protein
MYLTTSQAKFSSDEIRDFLAPELLRHRLPSRVTVPAFFAESGRREREGIPPFAIGGLPIAIQSNVILRLLKRYGFTSLAKRFWSE